MANTIARATGTDNTGRQKITTRLGSKYAEAQANTWRTFASVTTFANGAGRFTLTRDGRTIASCTWDTEEPRDPGWSAAAPNISTYPILAEPVS